MLLPAYGLCLPCSFVHARDGDTVVVRLKGGSFDWAIRLADAWVTDDKQSPIYQRALELAEKTCQQASDEDRLAVFLPIDEIPRNPLSAVTFDRVPAYLFVDSETTLGELLKRKGLAGSSRKTQPS
jgi:endonuclease YncB( thermonuclease family)